MPKIDAAQKILKALGLPNAQQNEISALTLLALCNLREKDPWKKAERISLGVSKGIMQFIANAYQKTYAPNTRETVRRQVLHQFIQAGIVEYNPDNPDLPVNSPRAHYAISAPALKVIQSYRTKTWEENLQQFQDEIGMLRERYRMKRKGKMVPITLEDGRKLVLSPGKHNEVQRAVIEEFAPRYAKGAKLLYVGDTEKKDLFIEQDKLKEIGIPIGKHSKLPDVVLYQPDNKWIYLIEAVTSHGPISPKRMVELEELLVGCEFGKIYVTAFPDIAEFKKHSKNIAWETEVWIVEFPDHLIHFNGDRFMGPR